MFSRLRPVLARVCGFAAMVLVAAAGSMPNHALAQVNNNNNNNNNFNNTAVGGVLVDPSGVLTNATRDEMGKLHKIWAAALQPAPGPMNRFSKMRHISLRGLNDEIEKSLKAGAPLSEAVACMAGLQRVQYVLVYPERNDIVLVGPAEGWRADASGNLVGVTTGQAVMLLDDLVTALRAAAAPVKSTMSCSINPTPEGIQRLESLNRLARNNKMAPQPYAAGMKEQLGPQTISITGVPETSHFARVMVGADYRMKRISMNFEPSPVAGLRGYFEMISGRAAGSLPRFWLQPEYGAVVRDDAGLAWEFRGGSVRAMAENDFLDATGQPHPSGKADAVSQRWADMMTSHYDALAAADPIFGKLRNCMDMAVVGALLVRENLPAKVQNPLPVLTGNALPTMKLDAPKRVASESNLARKGKNWIFAAGGVQMNPWAVLEKTETSAQVASVRDKVGAAKATSWWWD